MWPVKVHGEWLYRLETISIDLLYVITMLSCNRGRAELPHLDQNFSSNKLAGYTPVNVSMETNYIWLKTNYLEKSIL